MKSRTRELIEQGDALFNKRQSLHGLWQEIALNFYPERADFTGNVAIGTDRYNQLMTGVPVMYRRDLANALSAMLRPRDKPWFRPRTHDDKINEDVGAKAFLDDRIGGPMRTTMYAKDAQFIRATKSGDNDFATFGQCVISVDPNHARNGLLYRSWHLRDIAWCESDELKINTVHHNWFYGARDLDRKYPGKVAAVVKTAAEKEPYREIKCRRLVIPADDYDYAQPARYAVRKLPFVAITVDCENDTILEETPVKRINYVIPRWATVSGSQYAHSPATAVALADARLLQQITLTLLEAGQKVVDPPWMGYKEAIQGPLQMFAGGMTWVDMEYDEKTGHPIQQLPIDAKGLGWGGEREQVIMQMIKEALYLNQIDVPYPKGDMTATEYQGRVRDYIMRALPLFEPMEVEYNGGLCELTFDTMVDMHAFGRAFQDMPQILAGEDIRWEFESPLQAANERAKSQAFLQSAELLKTAVAFDPGTIHDFDVSKAFRDAVAGTEAPADWVVPEQDAQAAKEQSAQAAAQQQQVAAMGQGADVALKAGQAAAQMGLGAESLRGAGLV